MSIFPLQAYQRVLVVVKQTSYQMYQQLKARGQAPLAVRWEHLKERDTVHQRCVQDVLRLLHSNACTTHVVGREELHHHHIGDHDLMVTVGGDGTALSSSHFLRGTIPLLAINSDPDLPSDKTSKKQTGHSVGALCACSSLDMSTFIPEVLFKDALPRPRSRILVTISSTYHQTTLPPALNDVLLAHPSPAAMSRFEVSGRPGKVPSGSNVQETDVVGEKFKMSSRSSGMWISTATGSTGAMAAAGGTRMPHDSGSMQWRIRDESPRSMTAPDTPLITSGFVDKADTLEVKWDSLEGVAYVDGHYVKFDLELGDHVQLS
eukprot:CAMPEP_0114399954 /NCGR_PEP_ID=MMETSP0102-20121206/16022_1 /TAXON_ID=38822 ORGANISM="Pteridomonas danica, Strain PT" /NCGR_SAMPLE_ID=MMETSP0102 /ASSEMBLY_ACC=CAM_ASM_000212 /LENGTH=318 /DNA_ID=CAMNT_0001562065 /DNA_START=25 /DNA_END=978 /DNA_ORIENTATION=-